MRIYCSSKQLLPFSGIDRVRLDRIAFKTRPERKKCVKNNGNDINNDSEVHDSENEQPQTCIRDSPKNLTSNSRIDERILISIGGSIKPLAGVVNGCVQQCSVFSVQISLLQSKIDNLVQQIKRLRLGRKKQNV